MVVSGRSAAGAADAELKVAEAAAALSKAKADRELLRERTRPILEGATPAPKTSKAAVVAPPPELDEQQKAAQAEQDQADQHVRACKAALLAAEQALRRRRLVQIAEALQEDCASSTFHQVLHETGAELMRREPMRAAAIAAETRRDACHARQQERLDEAEMKGIIDPDFERDVQALSGKFDLADLLHDHEWRIPHTTGRCFPPPPRAPGFKYPPAAVRLPNHIKLHKLAQFKGGDPVLIGEGKAAREVQVQKVELADPSLPPRHPGAARRPAAQKDAAGRQHTRWTEEEVAALQLGVTTFGEGQWDVVLETYEARFQAGRTPADLRDKWAADKSRQAESYEAVYLVRYCSSDTTWERTAPRWVTAHELAPAPRELRGEARPDGRAAWRRVWPHNRPFGMPPGLQEHRPAVGMRRSSPHAPPSHRHTPRGPQAAVAPSTPSAGEAGSEDRHRPHSAPQQQLQHGTPRRPMSARPVHERPRSARLSAELRSSAEPGTRFFVGDIVGQPVKV